MTAQPDLAALAAEVATLAARLAALEDERAVHDVLTRYGLTMDAGDADACAALYAEDCTVDIDGMIVAKDRDGVRGMVASDAHQAILPNCAHVMGPFTVSVNGDHAVATGYATVSVRGDDGIAVWRQAFGRWELERASGTWLIAHRTSRATGNDGGAALIRRMTEEH